jgi:polar amino acid transport system substrate-binding protein
MLPAAIRETGTIRVARTFERSPFEHYDTGDETIRGLDKDIGDALSARLGVTLELTSMGAEEIVPALISNRFDMAMSMTGDADAGAQVELVEYFKSGGGFLVKKDNPKNVEGLDDICGLTVAIVMDTTEVEDAKRASDACEAASKAPVKQDLYPITSEVVLALENTNADVAMIDTFAGDYIAHQRKAQFEVPGPSYAPRPHGIVLPKTSGQLANALRATLDTLIADGTYDDILARWGQHAGAVRNASINDGVDPA